MLLDEQSEFAGTNYIVGVRTIDGSPPVKLGDGDIGRYSPDGKWVSAVINGQSRHFTLLPTGAGEPKDVTVDGLEFLQLVDFLPGGQLLLTGAEHGHGFRCYTRLMAGGPLKAITREGIGRCRPSPDSRRVVGEEATGALWLSDLDGQGQPIPNTENMVPIRWADSRSILTFRKGEMPARVFQIDVASGKQKVVRMLAPTDRAGVSQIQTVAGSPDGHTFAYSYQQVLYDLYVVEELR